MKLFPLLHPSKKLLGLNSPVGCMHVGFIYDSKVALGFNLNVNGCLVTYPGCTLLFTL